jgi:hypothetical protein
MSYVDEGQRSRRGFAAGRSGKGIFRGALKIKTALILRQQAMMTIDGKQAKIPKRVTDFMKK